MHLFLLQHNLFFHYLEPWIAENNRSFLAEEKKDLKDSVLHLGLNLLRGFINEAAFIIESFYLNVCAR